MLAMRGLDKGNKSICIGQKERDTGTFLFNSVLKKTGIITTKLTESILRKGKIDNDKKSLH